MAELPIGTVTFLFTDVEGSTRLLRELGDAYADALAEHRRVLRDAFARHGGVEVDTQGDAFFVAFARASDALAAARDAQSALSGRLRVRMGVHTGEPLVTEEGYVGMDVHRAARIAAVGYGGQILVSQSARELVGADGLRDLGEHRLKDLTAPEGIYQLGGGDFPPLKSLNATNLPITTNALVGRESELADLSELLRDSVRLVTLTGTGGTGKTRLALQVGAELVEAFPGGVFFVPLAGVGRHDLVPSTIAAAIGVRDFGELADRDALLVIDNFEHLLDASPSIGDLLRATTRVKVLATSRAPLRVGGEHEYPLDPLPDDEAVALLTERARAVRRDFIPDDATREICRRLEGLPLALELAASRLRSLDSGALLGRLEQRLPVLTSGRRDAPERQRTLRATIAWSYDLLDGELQEFFARLGVFATFTLEAAEEVAGADFDAVDALVEASLLKPLRGDRYLMLETIREYALEQLEAGGEGEDTRLRHAEYFLALADRANLHTEDEGPMRHDLVAHERDNIRAALDWTIAAGRAELGLQLGVALENFWVTAGDPAEGIDFFKMLLEQADSCPPELHALALRCIGNCTVYEIGEREALPWYEQSLAESRALGDELRVAVALHRIAANLARSGEPDRAGELIEESLAFCEQHDFQKGAAQCLTLQGDLARRGGALEKALELYERAYELSQTSGYTWWEKVVLFQQAMTMFELERPADAARFADKGLALALRMRDRRGMIDGLAVAARAAVGEGDDELAGRLWGALEAEERRAPIPGWADFRIRLGKPVLDGAGPGFETARSVGERMSLQDAVELALAAVD